MTLLADFLEDFGTPSAPQPVHPAAPALDEAELEKRRLEAYEEGYQAGWDDAVKAQTDEAARLSGTFGQHLSDLSFTYHEAYGALLGAVSPLLQEMVDKVLPTLARQTMGAHIVEQLQKMTQQIGTVEVVIAVPPGAAGAVTTLVEGDFAFPLRVEEDDTLGADQADIRFGDTEKQIDLSELLTACTAAVEEFAEDTRRISAHG